MSVQGDPTRVAGISTTLECSVTSGNPEATLFTWTKGNAVVQEESSSSSFTFIPTAADNGEDFKCTASNGVGTDPSASITLEVQCE